VARTSLIEQEYDVELQPHFDRRGRRACEVQSPVLANVVTEVLDAQSQADPKFPTNVLFTRVTGKFLRSLLESHPDLADAKPPSVRTCQRLMNRLGSRQRPQRAESSHAIYETVDRVRRQARARNRTRVLSSIPQQIQSGGTLLEQSGTPLERHAADRCGLQRSQTLPRWSVVIEPLRVGLAPSG